MTVDDRVRAAYHEFLKKVGHGQYTHYLLSLYIAENEPQLAADMIRPELRKILLKHKETL